MRRLGMGGHAEVWEAERRDDGRRLALKVLTQVRSASDEAMRRFRQEGRLAASLSHLRAVYVVSADEVERRPCIAMELMAGGSVQDLLDRSGPLPPRRAVDLTLDVIEGLDAAQRLGIVHRDIKPSNCFLDESGRAKIGDFGISKSLELDQGLTATGAFLGTPAFASPEQIRGRTVDLRSDMYSLGATLYALIAGRPPFEAADGGELLARILTEEPVPLIRTEGKVPRGLQRAVLRLLAKDPAKRFQDYATLRSALLPFSSQALAPAKPLPRSVAYLADGLPITAMWMALISAYEGLSARETLRRLSEPIGTFTMAEHALQFVLTVAYFSLLEWGWQRTPGKHLLGLRVANLQGGRPSLMQAFSRALVFCGAISIPAWVGFWFVGQTVLAACLSFAGLLALFLGMRRRSGYAGLHDLASGTRVLSLRKEEARVAPPERASGSIGQALASEATGSLGPYRLVQAIWSAGGEALFLGSDDPLERQVLIHMTDAAAESQTAAGAKSDRPIRLMRLQGGWHEGRRWEAFESPSGMPFEELVRRSGRLGWAEMRRHLLQLMEELVAGIEAADLPPRLSLEQLWVDQLGQLKLLEFPARDPENAEESASLLPVDRWPTLLRRFLILGLEGTVVDDADPAGRPPMVPLPEHAKHLVGRLFQDRLDAARLKRLAGELRDLMGRPASLSKGQRLRHLVWTYFSPLAFGAIICAAVLISLMRKHTTGVPPLDSLGVVLLLPAFPLAMVAPFATLQAFLFRGGLMMRLFGIEVQDRYGRGAGRLRCLLRAATAWLPIYLVYAPQAAYGVLRWFGWFGGPGTPRPGQGPFYYVGYTLANTFDLFKNLPGGAAVTLLACDVILLLFFLAGTVYTVIHPERGIQDRSCGTYLVPR